ncbi:DNA polymerase II [Candidatus Pacearchaeota archaeon]|nr:DNA polymerase II [Candidatus Pacearchaeota archaeon]
MKGFVVYATYSTIEGKTQVELYGRLENGESFLTTNTVEPYFFIKKSDSQKASPLLKKYKVEDTNLKTFHNEPVIKISSATLTELNLITKALKLKNIQIYEADIRPQYRFLMDCNIKGSMEIDGDYEESERIDRIYKNPSLKTAEFKPELNIVSIDTESGPSGLYCVGIHSKNYKKNFMITSKKLENTQSVKTEAEALIKFKEELLKLDPDIITGWNVIDADFVFLRDLFQKHKIPFDLGRTDEQVKLRIEENFFRSSSADIPGRVVLDGLNLIRDPFIQEAPSIKNSKFDTYTLEDVSQSLLGQGKLLKGKDRHEEIDSLYKSQKEKDLQKLVDYNLLDCKLAYDIITKPKIDELAIDRSQLTGMPLDRLQSSIAAFDSVYIREARKKNLVSPTTHYTEKETPIKGGYVYSSKSGIFHNVLILDFKSLYPSIIRTFNIDPASFLEKKEPEAIESPNKAYFRNDDGILPIIIENLHKAREKAKKEKRELASYAIKIIMNSFFGVLASPNCRYFSLKIANAITHFGQMIIQLTAKEIEKKGYKVIYSDTDSVFVETNLPEDKANKAGEELGEYITKFYEDYVKKYYNRKSYLELQFAKQYLSLMIPAIRNAEGEVAAKKRYAGLHKVDGKEVLEIVGLEAIRGDWTEAAREFQRELLMKVFHKEPVEVFIKDYIKKIRQGKIDEQLIYRKSIRKNLDEYTKTTPPHVKAARKLPYLDSNVIQYYITENGPEPIQKHTSKLDYDHYIKKQIEPIANQVLSLLGKSFEDVAQASKQVKLF